MSVGSGRLRLGLSRCLGGESVRYDGGHKRERFLVEALAPHVEWVGVCPEVECGLPTPREPMNLEDDPAAPRLRGRDSRVDHTDRLLRWCDRWLDEQDLASLDGFVLKSRSPSCEPDGVPVYGEAQTIVGQAPGLFAATLSRRCPTLPVISEASLAEADARRIFLETARARWRWSTLRSEERASGQFLEEFDLQMTSRELPPLRSVDTRSFPQGLADALQHPPTAAGHAAALESALLLLPRMDRSHLLPRVRSRSGGAPPPPDLLRQIRERAEGTPLLRQHYLDPALLVPYPD